MVKPVLKTTKMKKFAFLDRDGVINEDFGYVHSMEKLQYLRNSIVGMKGLQKAGYSLHIITNQAGIAKGYYTEKQFNIFMSQMLSNLARRGVNISGYSYCPHHVRATVKKYRKKCLYRKPGPNMILDVLKQSNCHIEESMMIGDKLSDVKAAQAAGISRIFWLNTRKKTMNADSEINCISDWLEIFDYLP